MTRPSMRDILTALEFARTQMFRFTSPDFIRARVSEDRVQRLCERLVQGSGVANTSTRRSK